MLTPGERERLDPLPPEFLAPNDTAPLDVEAIIAATPEDAGLRGMYYQSYLDELKKRGLPVDPKHRYAAWRLYPMRPWQRFMVETAGRLYPELPLRGALRQLGLIAYSTFASSMVGRVIFGVLGKDVERIMRVASKGYEQSLSRCEVDVVDVTRSHARVHLRGVHSFLESYQLGVFEGALVMCERRGDVHHRPIAPGEAEIFCRWI
jgi:uncharacterized protein (TIGR02265 family)